VQLIRSNLERFGLTGILVELGYFYEPAAAPHHAKQSQWSIQWRPRLLDRRDKIITVLLPADALGARWASRWPDMRRIVLIDTGDEGALSQTWFSELDCRDEEPSDHDGHGTSIGSLIRMVAPAATVQSFRVIAPGSQVAESSTFINAMNVATLSSGLCDIVCVAQRADLSVLTGGSQAGLKTVLAHNAQRGGPMPVIVCAAGNEAPAPMAFPATIPGVIVAAGLDANDKRADYNCPAQPGTTVHVIEAFGGVIDDPIGVRSGPGGNERDLYGSSYATAMVTGALAYEPARSKHDQ
jgi:Subtilase family